MADDQDATLVQFFEELPILVEQITNSYRKQCFSSNIGNFGFTSYFDLINLF